MRLHRWLLVFALIGAIVVALTLWNRRPARRAQVPAREKTPATPALGEKELTVPIRPDGRWHTVCIIEKGQTLEVIVPKNSYVKLGMVKDHATGALLPGMSGPAGDCHFEVPAEKMKNLPSPIGCLGALVMRIGETGPLYVVSNGLRIDSVEIGGQVQFAIQTYDPEAAGGGYTVLVSSGRGPGVIPPKGSLPTGVKAR